MKKKVLIVAGVSSVAALIAGIVILKKKTKINYDEKIKELFNEDNTEDEFTIEEDIIDVDFIDNEEVIVSEEELNKD